MPQTAEIALLATDAADWPDELDRLRARLGAPTNPTLFPAHFLKATLPKIGGAVATFRQGGEVAGAGFLFPRALRAGRRVYTLCFHAASADLAAADVEGRMGEVGRLLGD